MPVQSALPAQISPIRMQLEVGYEGHFRGNAWVPLLISISNNGPELAGELRVTSGNTPGLSANAYATAIDLANLATKQVFLNIRVVDYASTVQVDLVTADGIVASAIKPLKLVRDIDLLFAVVTESPRGAVDLQSAKGSTGDVFQINWRIDNIPRTAEGLAGLDALVLTDADSGNLSADQRRAIREWLLSGGHLVVTGGPNWQKTQAGVSDLLPLTPRTTTTLTNLSSLATYAGLSGAEVVSETPVVVVQGDLNANAQILAIDSAVPLVSRLAVGEGLVDYLAYDPGLDPFPAWKDRGRFWFNLFSTTQQRPSWSYGFADQQQAAESVKFVKGLQFPDVLQLLGFFGIYILLVGPLNYLVLRLIKKPELAWITIPLVVIGTSVYAYATGFNLRGTLATINRMAVVQVWNDSTRGEIDGLVGIVAPRRANYTLTARNSMALQSLDTPIDQMNPALQTGYTIYQGSNYEARGVPVDAGIPRVFMVEGYVTVQPMEGSATLFLGSESRLGVTFTTAEIKGTIKNTTGQRLTSVAVLGMGNAFPLDDLNPGDERSFTIKIPVVASSMAAVGNARPQPISYGNPYGRGYSPFEKTIEDIMGRAYRENIGGDLMSSLTEQENRRRLMFLRSVAIDADAGGGRGTRVYVTGWTGQSPMDIDLADVQYVSDDTTLWVYSLPVDIAPVRADRRSEIPGAFLTWSVTPESKLQDAVPYLLNMRLGDDAVFRYQPLPELRNITVDTINVVVRAGNYAQSGSGKYALWNWGEERWEDVTLTGSGNLTGQVRSAARYVGPGAAIQLKIEPSPGGPGYLYFEGIDISFVGTLNS